MDSQVVVKTLLIASFVVLALVIVVPRRGARPLAIRRLTVLLVFLLAASAVIRPEWVAALARLVGVGRGTDLLLYALVVLFAGDFVASRLRYSNLEQTVTELARQLAILTADPIGGPGEKDQAQRPPQPNAG